MSRTMVGLPKSHLSILPGKTHVGLMIDSDTIYIMADHFLEQNQSEEK